MNNEKLGMAPQMHAGGDAKQAIEFPWPNHARVPSFVKWRLWLQQVSPCQLGMQQINSSVWAPLLGCLWSLESLFLYLPGFIFLTYLHDMP